MKNNAQLPNEIFIFNLGRLWQEVISDRWDDVEYLYNFIQEITQPDLLEKHSKNLKKLSDAVDSKDFDDVNRALEGILGW